jgi:propanediol utilization protein
MKRIWTVILSKLAHEQQTSMAELERLVNLNDNTDELSELIDSELTRLVINEFKIRKWNELNPTKHINTTDVSTGNQ